MLNFCDFIQVYVLTTNHHLKPKSVRSKALMNKEGREERAIRL